MWAEQELARLVPVMIRQWCVDGYVQKLQSDVTCNVKLRRVVVSYFCDVLR